MKAGAAGARLIRTVEGIREFRSEARELGRTVALVPTMGFLHEGHLRLVDRGGELADIVVTSVFVNPTQFAPGEDFEDYPRDLDHDVALASARGTDVVFAPEEEEVYPVPQEIWVEPAAIAQRLCGLSRPGHFRGVLTVVMKLFVMVEPDVAVFGRKDFQQSVLIRRMVEEFRLPIRVEVAPVVRDADGLALSSRNTYLTDMEREAALSLSRGLRRVRRAFREGIDEAEELVALARATMEEGGAEVEYVEIVEPEELTPVVRGTPDAVCAVAARVGSTRLIDNASLGEPSSLDALEGGV